MPVVMDRIIQPLKYKRTDFPEGAIGTREYFKYFISVMFEGPAGGAINQTTALITGKLGAGKTTFIVAFGWWMKEIFGMPVSTDFHLMPPFGGYEYLGDLGLVDEMIKVNEMSSRGAEWEGEYKSKLFRRVVLWDEVYKKVSNRRSMSDMNLLVGDILKQQRHFQSVFLFAAPAQNELDVKGVDQYITVEVSGLRSPTRDDVSVYHIFNRSNFTEAWIELYLPNYWPMFHSFSPPTMRLPISMSDMVKAVKKAFCPICNKEYDGNNKHCGKCGASLSRATFCPNDECRSLVAPKYQYCPKCGRQNPHYVSRPKGEKEK